MTEPTPELPTPPSEFAPFESFARGDRIRFVTHRGELVPAPEGSRRTKLLKQVEYWRTGTVLHASLVSLVVDCDMPNPMGHRALLRRSSWERRQPTKIQNETSE